MATKTISISAPDPDDTTKELKMTFQHVTEVKPKEELDTDSTDTFDGPVVRGNDTPAYTIDVGLLDLTRTAEGRSAMENYVYLRKILRSLHVNKGTILISEIMKPKGEAPFKVSEQYDDVLLASNEHTINPKDLTARDLSFKAESCTELDPVLV